jgi:hypothetical protein
MEWEPTGEWQSEPLCLGKFRKMMCEGVLKNDRMSPAEKLRGDISETG